MKLPTARFGQSKISISCQTGTYELKALGVKLLEHAMKTVERVRESRIRLLVYLDEMKFGFMPGKETTDALFLVRRMQEEYRDKENHCTCAL